MSQTTNCPQRSTWVDYLLGKLSDGLSQKCEQHLVECQQCEDTIRGLDVNDTLDQLTRDAMVCPRSGDQRLDEGDRDIVDGLLQKVVAISEDYQNIGPEFDSLTIERANEVLALLSDSDHATDLGRLANYRVLSLLGAGSSGVVFEALDESLDRLVALKVLRPSLGQLARERFTAEARAAAAIDHPNVITIYQVGVESSLAFMAMQRVSGSTLEQKLLADVYLSESEVVKMVRQVAMGLSAAHAKNLIHRDIKPANIWLEPDFSNVKILDFGLARIADEQSGITSTGMIAGTPSYMSPEQSRGTEIDQRSDLFSLGCVMYRALTGKLPFGSPNVLATLQAIQNESPTPPNQLNSKISTDLSDLTMAMLEKNPANRPPDSAELLNALESKRSLWGFPVVHYSHPSHSENANRPQLHPVLTGGRSGWIAAFVLAALFGLGSYLFGSDIYRISTDRGELIIETVDQNIKVEILKGNDLVRVIDLKTEQRIDIRSGEYEVKLENGQNSFQLSSDRVSMSRGGRQIVVITKKQPDMNGQPLTSKEPNSLTTNREGVRPPATETYEERIQNELDAAVAQLERLNAQNKQEEVEPLILIDARLRKNIAELDVAGFHNKTARLAVLMQRRIGLIREKVEFLQRLSADSMSQPGGSDTQNQIQETTVELQLALNALLLFESENGLASSQPTYDGKTIDQWLEIAKTEKSFEHLHVAVDGIAELQSKINLPAVMRCATTLARHAGSFNIDQSPRGRLVNSLVTLMHKLPPKSVAEFFVAEVEFGNQNSREFLNWLVTPQLQQRQFQPKLLAHLKTQDSKVLSLLTELGEKQFGDPPQLFWTINMASRLVVHSSFVPSETHLDRLARAIEKTVTDHADETVELDQTRAIDTLIRLDHDSVAVFGLLERLIKHPHNFRPWETMALLGQIDRDSEGGQMATQWLAKYFEETNFSKTNNMPTEYLHQNALAALTALKRLDARRAESVISNLLNKENLAKPLRQKLAEFENN